MSEERRLEREQPDESPPEGPSRPEIPPPSSAPLPGDPEVGWDDDGQDEASLPGDPDVDYA